MRKKLFFGRVKSRILTDLQKKNSSIFLKTRKIKNSLFRKHKIVIEIGFGHGEHLVYLSKKFTKKIIIGIDPFQNGLAKVAKYCIENNIKNLYIFPYVFEKFHKKYQNYIYDDLYILFPDPWPKKRHQKRRLFDENFLRLISKKGNKNSKIFFKTDSYNYYEQVYNIVIKFKKRELIRDFYHNLNTKIKTKYHQKAIKNESKIYSLIIENN